MLQVIFKGGPMMVPLMALSLLSIAVIYERWLAFRRASVDSFSLRQEVISLLTNGETDKAIQLCANTPGPVSAILLVGLRRYQKLIELGKDKDSIDDQVTKAMSDYAPHVIEVLENRLNLLAMIGTVAPILGMTGTVTGMIKAFTKIQAMGAMDAQAVAGGIAEALITTAAGLIISLPAVIVYNLYTRRVEHFVLEIEDAATRLVEYLTIES